MTNSTMEQLYTNIVYISIYKIYIADNIKLYINTISTLNSIHIYELYRFDYSNDTL